MFRTSLLALIALSFTLGACQTANAVSSPAANARPREAATGPGVVLAAWGSGLANAMDDADQARNRQAENRAFIAPVGQQITWKNSASGDSGTIAPIRDSYAPNGAYCRDFQQTVTLAGQTRQGGGKACQQPDGSWQSAQ
jgi:surface antigen